MTMKRAYSILEVKEITESDGFVRIKGIASTPTTDRIGDIVEPLGARFKTPMPLLWQHRHDAPVGNVTFAKATEIGIPFEAALPIIAEEGTLKTRVDEAIQSIKYQLVTAVSIGFSAVKGATELLKGGGYRFKEWDWHELSLVTLPANSEAVITAIKSADRDALASAGLEGDTSAPAPDLSGQSKRGPVKLKRELTRKPQHITITPRK